MSKRGRSSKPKTAVSSRIDPISPTARRRIQDLAVRGAADPRLGTQVGRLCLEYRMTHTEAAAGERAAEEYGRYERSAGLKRWSQSPSYEVGYGKSNAPEREHDQKAKEKWLALQGQIPSWPRSLRRNFEMLFCEDQCILPTDIPDVRALCRDLAGYYGMENAPKKTNRHPANGR